MFLSFQVLCGAAFCILHTQQQNQKARKDKRQSNVSRSQSNRCPAALVDGQPKSGQQQPPQSVFTA
jgi:hypothetical protein